MFGRTRRPRLSRRQVEAMIAAVESRGIPPAPRPQERARPQRGLPFGVAVERFDRASWRGRRQEGV